MEQHKINRINELAKKSKAEGLTKQEQAEQKNLRTEYVTAFRKNLMNQLDNTYILEKDGTKRKLRK